MGNQAVTSKLVSLSGTIADGEQVSIDDSSLGNVNANNAQEVASQLNNLWTIVNDLPSGGGQRPPIGAITPFTTSVTVGTNNFENFDNEVALYTRSDDARVSFILPSDTVINNRYPVSITILHQGGTQRFTSGGGAQGPNNTIRVDVAGANNIRRNSETGTLLNFAQVFRNDFATFIKEDAASPWVFRNTTLSSGALLLPDGIFNLPANSTARFSPSLTFITLSGGQQNPVTGDAYRVLNDDDNFAEYGVKENDVIVALVDNPSRIRNADNEDWLIIRNAHNNTISLNELHFLNQVTETDTDNYVRVQSELTTGQEALVWLVNPDNTLTEAPFLSPNTGSSPDSRNSPSVTYIGGRDARQTNGDAIPDLGRFDGDPVLFESEIIVGINGNYLNNVDLNDIRLEIREQDETFVTSFNLNDNFVKPVFADITLSYFILSTRKISDSFTLYRWHQGYQARIVINRPDRQFTFSNDVKVGSDNILNGHWVEDDLSQSVQAKLNKQGSILPPDRARLDAIEESTVDTNPTEFTYRVKFGDGSANPDDYRDWRNQDGLVQDFQNNSTYTIVTPIELELTGTTFTGTGTVTLTEVIPSLFDNTRTYTLFIPHAPDNINYNPLDHPVSFTATLSIITPDGLAPSVKIDSDNFRPEFLNTIVNHENTALPAALVALNNQATVFNFDNVDFVSENNHAGINTMFSFLKNRPDERLGDTPPTTNALTNEITNSSVSAEIAALNGLFYPRTIGGEFDNGVEITTNGALVGAGAVQEPVTITNASASNFALVLGFWFDTQVDTVITTVRSLIRVKERGSSTFRRLFGIEGLSRINDQDRVETGAVLTERTQGSAGTSATVPVTHHLYTTNGELIHVFSGVGAGETLFRVNEARGYTFSASLAANGNNQGTQTISVTIANLNQNQDFGQHTLNYTANGHPHSQLVNIEYVANSSTYGGPGHTLRFELHNGLADNVNFDIDHLSVSCSYVTNEVITTPATYAEANAGGDHLFQANKKNRMIVSFRKNNSNNNLQAIYVLATFDTNGNPTVHQSSVVDFGYSVYDLDWTQVRLGNTNQMVIQNIQGFTLNTDTPLNQFPTHAIMNGWLTSHDVKETDYVWDNAAAPETDIEAIHFPENVNFQNFIKISPDGTRWSLGVDNSGSTTWTKIT